MSLHSTSKRVKREGDTTSKPETPQKRYVRFNLEENETFTVTRSVEDRCNAWLSKKEHEAAHMSVSASIATYLQNAASEHMKANMRGLEHVVDPKYRMQKMQQGQEIRQSILMAQRISNELVSALSAELSVDDVSAARAVACSDHIEAMAVHFRFLSDSSPPTSRPKRAHIANRHTYSLFSRRRIPRRQNTMAN